MAGCECWWGDLLLFPTWLKHGQFPLHCLMCNCVLEKHTLTGRHVIWRTCAAWRWWSVLCWLKNRPWPCSLWTSCCLTSSGMKRGGVVDLSRWSENRVVLLSLNRDVSYSGVDVIVLVKSCLWVSTFFHLLKTQQVFFDKDWTRVSIKWDAMRTLLLYCPSWAIRSGI